MFLKSIKTIIFSFVLFFYLCPFSMAATHTVWSENFESYEVGTTSGGALDLNGIMVPWNAYAPLCADWFEVRVNPNTGSKWMEARDLDGNGYWITGKIPIYGYTGVGISIDIAEKGTLEWNDYMLLFYSITDTISENRNWTLFDYRFNDFGKAESEISGLSGGYLSLGIVIRNDSNNERHGFDNVLVTAATVPVPTSFLLLGSGIIGLIGYRRRNRQ